MKTMLDKCAVAGDITQAIDRRGAWSCAVTVIGGAENTAVKLQSADSAGGEFTDFKTLISADEAEEDQYKGFVLDLSGAGNFIKIVGATMATCVLGDCDHDVKTVAIKAGEIPSGADLEDNKTATINVSTYTEPVEIEPTAGKDGMKKATVTLSNIPSPTADVYAFYYWKNENDSTGCFTLSENPQVGDNVYYENDSGTPDRYGDPSKIISVSAMSIDIGGGAITRDNAGDITYTKS